MINVINIYGQTPFLDKLGFIFVASYLMVTILGGLTAIFYSPRTWCQFCPIGSIQHMSYKAGKALGVNMETDEKVTIKSNTADEFNIWEEVELDYYHKDNIRAENVMLVGGGIGITPFIPIVEDIVHNNNHINNVKLIYGVNEEDQFLYRDFFEDMDAESDKFEFIPVVAFDHSWLGEKGFVTDVMDNYDLDDYKIYMCGPGPMEEAARRLLAEKDFDQSHLFAEST